MGRTGWCWTHGLPLQRWHCPATASRNRAMVRVVAVCCIHTVAITLWLNATTGPVNMNRRWRFKLSLEHIFRVSHSRSSVLAFSNQLETSSDDMILLLLLCVQLHAINTLIGSYWRLQVPFSFATFLSIAHLLWLYTWVTWLWMLRTRKWEPTVLAIFSLQDLQNIYPLVI